MFDLIDFIVMFVCMMSTGDPVIGAAIGIPICVIRHAHGFRAKIVQALEPHARQIIADAPRLLVPPAVVTRRLGSAPAPQEGKLALADFLTLVNEQPVFPHLMIIGPTRGGKTTLAMALTATRAGQFLIIDPKPQKKDEIKWNGMSYIHGDLSRSPLREPTLFAKPCNDAIEHILAEFDRRFVSGNDGQMLTVVFDEVPWLVRHCPNMDIVLRELTRLTAAYGIRLILILQDSQVKTLGLEGEGAIRQNFIKVRIHVDLTDTGDVTERKASVETLGSSRDIELDGILELSRSVVSKEKMFQVNSTQSPELLSSLFTENLPDPGVKGSDTGVEQLDTRIAPVSERVVGCKPGVSGNSLVSVSVSESDTGVRLTDPSIFDVTSVFPDTDTELKQLLNALQLWQDGTGETQAIEQAFQTKKSSTSPAYKRARALFKTAQRVCCEEKHE
jgi:hypothetical protein